ncbi:MAG: phosphatase PAP2 family protein [Saprospirales bacterium]|jgi:membrane-associated phospholipid phosphatase|nr:phosphatase PAP2 family protein [Saprospirales bacterium]MBK8920813.1 phosphatase PAP2 family protein [Saprospirales bacterium]
MSKDFLASPWFFIPVLLFLNAGLFLLLFLPYGQEILYLNSWRAEPLNTFFRWCTRLGEAPVFVVVGLLALLWRIRYALLIALAGLLISPASYLLKDKIGTDRPITYFEKSGIREAVVTVPGVELNGGQTSFPSGHTMAAFGMFGLVALITGRRIPWLGLACAWSGILVALSRIFLVQHFLIDVLGGTVIGLAIAGLVWSVNRPLNRFGAILDRGLWANRR